MKEEVESASAWWSEQLKDVKEPKTKEAFRTAFRTILIEKYTGHWYDKDRLRGSAYRCISFDGGRLDPVLKRAGDEAVVAHIDQLLGHIRDTIMFVNPGEVYVTHSEGHTLHYIYRTDSVSPVKQYYSPPPQVLPTPGPKVVNSPPNMQASKAGSASSSPVRMQEVVVPTPPQQRSGGPQMGGTRNKHWRREHNHKTPNPKTSYQTAKRTIDYTCVPSHLAHELYREQSEEVNALA